MLIEPDIKLDYKDVLFKPKRSTLSSRSEVNLERKFTFPNTDSQWEGIPVAAANMDTIGTFAMAGVLSRIKLLTCLHKHYTLKEYDILASMGLDNPEIYDYVAVSMGVSGRDLSKINKILKKFPEIKFICIDVANGYSRGFVEFVKKVRKKYKNKIIIAGNVVTGEMTEDLIRNGADIVKVGIGPGSVCTTRIQTGVGYPQLSAITGCTDAAHGVNGHIMADGGCTCAGDVSKAFGAGADFAMLGGMFAFHAECGGNIQEDSTTGEKFMEFYGMSSETAMSKYHGGVANYRSSEGKTIRGKYKNSIKNTVDDLLGGIRSTCTYVGARRIKDLPKCTTFIRVTQQYNEIFGADI